jgi:hypothetical protein
LARAVELVDALGEAGVWFAPIRHHSPACARAVRDLIAATGPAAALIEGPSQFDALVETLTDPATIPPVAVLSLQRQAGHDGLTAPANASFYPLADFSPEWVALRAAAASGAAIAFIDQSSALNTPELVNFQPGERGRSDSGEGGTVRNGDRPHYWVQQAAASMVAPSPVPRQRDSGGLLTEVAAVEALRGERYFAQSQTLTALAAREHCRDHDELWERLFEQRGAAADWRRLFGDVFVWSALARLDYEPEVLLAEGSVSREAVMASHIVSWRRRVAGPLVVVTGAFHTLALVEAVAASLSLAEPPADSAVLERMAQPPPAGRTASSTAEAWLVRYDLARLDALRGYGAGVRSPGFYQREWEGTGDASPVQHLALVARLVNAAGEAERISTAQVIEAAAQAHRLAQLRGAAHPGRTDLLDACQSCFAGTETSAALRQAVKQVFGGDKSGSLPPGAPAPPILAEARRRARDLRFELGDSTPRRTTLDIRRSASARRRSRFLWLMTHLETGFGRRLAGPDHIAGVGLGRAREQWEYAWTPLVEAALIGLVSEGATLADAARSGLRAAEAALEPAGQGRSAGAVAELAARAALVGLGDEVRRFGTVLDQLIEQDPSIESILTAVRRLLGLWRSRQVLELDHPEDLMALVKRAIPQLAYLAGQAGGVAEGEEAATVAALTDAHALLGYLEDPEAERLVRQAFERLRSNADTAPGVLGAVLALGAVDGDVSDDELGRRLGAVFQSGADLDHARRFLDGLMRAAPELVVHTGELFDLIDRSVMALTPAVFLEFLPDLRRSFSRLRPFETARLAGRVAARAGVGAEAVAPVTSSLTEADLRMGTAVELALAASLAGDGLEAWAGGRSDDADHPPPNASPRRATGPRPDPGEHPPPDTTAQEPDYAVNPPADPAPGQTHAGAADPEPAADQLRARPAGQHPDTDTDQQLGSAADPDAGQRPDDAANPATDSAPCGPQRQGSGPVEVGAASGRANDGGGRTASATGEVTAAERVRRWRLIFGRYADPAFSGPTGACALTGADLELDQTLAYLYDREYAARGHRRGPSAGGLDPSQLTAVSWLERTRRLFPKSTFERLQTEAVEGYGLSEVLADPAAAEALTPSPELGAALLSLRGPLNADLEEGLRIVIAKVVAQITERLRTSFAKAFSGRTDRFKRSFQPRAQNLDWRRTIQANLRNYDPERGQLVIDQVRFNARARRRLEWDVVLLVDQSASMSASVLYSAVCASILAALPGVNVRLIVFDTAVVDLTAQAGDPVGVLMTVQLGGGTDIAGALGHCESLVTRPARTVLALISDFEEGGSVAQLLASVSRLKGAGVKLLGLGALDQDARSVWDPHVGRLLAERGMEIAALTPDRFAGWLAEVMA